MSDKPTTHNYSRNALWMAAICNATSAACVVAAVVVHPADGWGWFLVMALLSHCTPRHTDDKGSKESK